MAEFNSKVSKFSGTRKIVEVPKKKLGFFPIGALVRVVKLKEPWMNEKGLKREPWVNPKKVGK